MKIMIDKILGLFKKQKRYGPGEVNGDVWGEVAAEVQDRIPKGFTIYGEIVGYTKDGSAIQKGYHYGCRPSTHRFLVYRVTFTSVDGHQIELGWPQKQEFCKKFVINKLYYLYNTLSTVPVAGMPVAPKT